MRIWVADDAIPIGVLFGVTPPPVGIDQSLMALLLDRTAASDWNESAVRELSQGLCDPEFETLFFLSPQGVRQSLERGYPPPDVVVLDWEGPGFSVEGNLDILRRVLAQSPAYVQVYTHLGVEGVEPHLQEAREHFPNRVLGTVNKAAVAPGSLRERVVSAWAGTIAGKVADDIRGRVRAAVEKTLSEMSVMPQGEIAAAVDGRAEYLLSLMLASVRDAIAADGVEVLKEIVDTEVAGESGVGLRRLLSTWYYYFPADDRVRRGDLIEMVPSDGILRLVVTPTCDLARFRKKTGGRLTLLRVVPLNAANVGELRAAGVLPTGVGSSITTKVDGASDMYVPLPNVPPSVGQRNELQDYLILCHGWETKVVADVAGNRNGYLPYKEIADVRRRCTLAEPFVSAVVAKVAGVMFSPGVPDLPASEKTRFGALLRT